jgi:hypothetical protein
MLRRLIYDPLYRCCSVPGHAYACGHATIDLKGLRRHSKHISTMHQRRPELYGRLTEQVKMWQDYLRTSPGISRNAQTLVNKAQLDPPQESLSGDGNVLSEN